MKKLIVLLAISFILFSCKKEEPVTPDVIVTTGTLDVKYKNKLVEVELKNNSSYVSYDTTSWTISDINQYEHIAKIKDVQPGKYICKLYHWKKDPQGIYCIFTYILPDSIEVKVNQTTQIKSVH